MTFKHFEDLWNWAEHVHQTQEQPESLETSCYQIMKLTSQFNEHPENLGQILLHLTNLARIKNMNSFACLKQAVQDFQSENLEESH